MRRASRRHVLRHSFASNLATKGVDQRIDEFMGHQTETTSDRRSTGFR